MLTIGDAKAEAILTIVKLFGKEYVKNKFNDACIAFPESDDINYEYFCGFEGDVLTNKWNVFARVLVNRETGDTIFLDFKLPDGTRMKNPLKPVLYS